MTMKKWIDSPDPLKDAEDYDVLALLLQRDVPPFERTVLSEQAFNHLHYGDGEVEYIGDENTRWAYDINEVHEFAHLHGVTTPTTGYFLH